MNSRTKSTLYGMFLATLLFVIDSMSGHNLTLALIEVGAIAGLVTLLDA